MAASTVPEAAGMAREGVVGWKQKMKKMKKTKKMEQITV